MKKHPSITTERLLALAEESMFGSYGHPGICIACGEDADGVEPDAEGYICESCGEPAVMGAEMAMMVYA